MMRRKTSRFYSAAAPVVAPIAALWLAMVATPALADVRAGVEAWTRGDYVAAVSEWEGPAAAGDADAMFNLAQAYRVGRGVPRDPARAEQLYFRASQLGHVAAGDVYGLMLFQNGRQEDALPYVSDAARRGDPRSQYLLGIAHFNGDLVPRDWVRAYALLTLANGTGLPQAVPAIAQMDEFIPLAQRQQAAGLAEQLRAEADQARSAEMAAVDLGVDINDVPQASSRVPRPIATTAVSPSVAAARAAIAEASEATGTDSPADAGASYSVAQSGPRASGPRATALPPAAEPRRSQPVAVPAPVSAPAPQVDHASGPWRVQLGAFSVAGNAENLWNRLSSRSELAGRERLLIRAGRVTKLQAGGYASQTEADAACRSLRNSGQDCLVTRQ